MGNKLQKFSMPMKIHINYGCPMLFLDMTYLLLDIYSEAYPPIRCRVGLSKCSKIINKNQASN